LTKLHEEIYRGTISRAADYFQKPIGEFTLVIEGRSEHEVQITGIIEKHLLGLYKKGISTKEAVAYVSATSGIPKKKIYQLWLKLTKGE
jgi:16S rRNA (cytidine1402-2'-O)-methyltransferase